MARFVGEWRACGGSANSDTSDVIPLDAEECVACLALGPRDGVRTRCWPCVLVELQIFEGDGMLLDPCPCLYDVAAGGVGGGKVSHGWRRLPDALLYG